MSEQGPSAEKDAGCLCAENVQRYAAHIDLVMRDCPAHPYYREPCIATFEPVSRRERPGTHTCTLGAGHSGPHFCATCGSEWEARVTSPDRGRPTDATNGAGVGTEVGDE